MTATQFIQPFMQAIKESRRTGDRFISDTDIVILNRLLECPGMAYSTLEKEMKANTFYIYPVKLLYSLNRLLSYKYVSGKTEGRRTYYTVSNAGKLFLKEFNETFERVLQAERTSR